MSLNSGAMLAVRKGGAEQAVTHLKAKLEALEAAE
jgi:hypothetical protein